MIKGLKQWVLSWGFVRDARRSSSDEAYRNAHILFEPKIEDNQKYLKFQLDKERANIMIAAQKDLRECMEDDTEKRAQEIADQKLAALLSPIDPTKILTLDKIRGSVYIGGEKATDGQLLNLKQEAEALEQFGIWAIMYESVKALAEKAMFVEGDSPDFLKKGRSMLYTLSTQKRIIDTLKSYQTPKNPPK